MMQLLGGYLLVILSLVSYSKQHFSFSSGKVAVQMDLLRPIESLEQCVLHMRCSSVWRICRDMMTSLGQRVSLLWQHLDVLI